LVLYLCDCEAVQGAKLVGDLPIELAPAAWLIGRWAGVGLGHYPGIPDFRFGQELEFGSDGRPFLNYWSRSWIIDDEGERIRPAASESGFLRPRPDKQFELLLTHPAGYAEVWNGSFEITGLETSEITGARAQLQTDAVVRTESAKPYTAGQRLYGLVEGELLWTFDMAAMGQPMQNHLAAQLKPVNPASA
jgi:hypothetical protein